MSAFTLFQSVGVSLPQEKTKIAIYFQLCFEEDVEFTLASIILNELEDAKKHVGHAPGFGAIALDKIPADLIKQFPKEGLTELDRSKYLMLNVSRVWFTLSLVQQPYGQA